MKLFFARLVPATFLVASCATEPEGPCEEALPLVGVYPVAAFNSSMHGIATADEDRVVIDYTDVNGLVWKAVFERKREP